MKNYEVYFEIYGKKMKSTVLAADAEDARIKVSDKLIFNKIELKKDTFNDIMDLMDDMSNFLKNKKS